MKSLSGVGLLNETREKGEGGLFSEYFCMIWGIEGIVIEHLPMHFESLYTILAILSYMCIRVYVCICCIDVGVSL